MNVGKKLFAQALGLFRVQVLLASWTASLPTLGDAACTAPRSIAI